nr:aminopeptidase N C-terminal domain-containing protein [Hyphomonadaceae bacterium]
HALAGAAADPAYAALLLTLPDVGELMQLEPGHKPAVLAAARAKLKSHLSSALDAQLQAVLGLHDRTGTFSPDAASAGRRALHAAVLDLLCSGEAVHGQELAVQAFAQATNMTDTMAALSALSIRGGETFNEALARFEARWSGTPLVMDKWFAVRAAAPSGDPLATMAALRQHPAFTLANPNRVRALAAPFALRNPVAFHREDGEGYALLARLIAEVDARNPALAATLCKLMESTGLAHADNRAAATRVLDGLASGRELSPNTSEILSKVRDGLG